MSANDYLNNALRNAGLVDEQTTDPTPEGGQTDDPERFRLYRLCPCSECGGTGRYVGYDSPRAVKPLLRCKTCRGEGRTLDLVASCGSPEAVGVALITLGREGEWAECPVGVLDRQGEKYQKWIVSPWLPSARNVSDAGRTLAHARHTP